MGVRIHAHSPTDVDWRAREGSPFGTMFEFAEGRMPPRLADVPDGDVTAWLDAFEAATDPRLRSRLGDLIWSRRSGPEPHEAAREACQALVTLRETARSAEGILRATFLEKALDLARTHGLADLTKELRVEIQAITEEDLDLKTISAEVQIDRAKVEQFSAHSSI